MFREDSAKAVRRRHREAYVPDQSGLPTALDHVHPLSLSPIFIFILEYYFLLCHFAKGLFRNPEALAPLDGESPPTLARIFSTNIYNFFYDDTKPDIFSFRPAMFLASRVFLIPTFRKPVSWGVSHFTLL